MDYHYKGQMPRDASGAMRRLVDIFSQTGFRVDTFQADLVEMTGPGMSSTRQSPLVGISKIEIRTHDGRLEVEAAFGGLGGLMRWMAWFIGGLAVFLLVLFAIIFRDREGFRLWIVVLPFAPWPVLFPLLRTVLKRRLTKTLDHLFHNLAMTN